MSDVTYADLADTALSLLSQYTDFGVEERNDKWFYLECVVRNALIAIKNKERFDSSFAGHVPKWQPIETAPKDGTAILGAYQFQGETDWYGIVRFIKDLPDGPSWVDQFCDDKWMEPTHWMPMPEPPND